MEEQMSHYRAALTAIEECMERVKSSAAAIEAIDGQDDGLRRPLSTLRSARTMVRRLIGQAEQGHEV